MGLILERRMRTEVEGGGCTTCRGRVASLWFIQDAMESDQISASRSDPNTVSLHI